MNCERATPYLTAFAADELPGATSAWVRAHLAGCPDCSAAVARHARISRALRTLPEDSVEPPPGFAAAVVARIEQREHHSARRILPIPLIPPSELARWPGEIARVVQDNREAILNAASTAAVAAGAAFLAWRAFRSIRHAPREA